MSSVSDPLQQNLPPVAVARRVSVLRMLLSDVGACIALALVVLAVLGAAFAPWLSPTDPYGNDLANTLKPPGEFGLLGTDGQGRDMITRLLFGLRTTLLMGLASVVIGGLIGGVIGFAAAYYPRLSGLLMRLMDVLLSFPAILFGLAIAAIFGPGLPAVIIALAIATIPLMARVVRGSALVVLQQGYIEAARSLGLGDLHIILRYVLPNCLSAIFVFVTLRFGQVILLGAALSFLGLGAQPPTAELGAMAADGRNFLFFAPHVSVLPSIVIFVIVLAFNVLGDALRDALDPKLRK
ncbi:MAG: ABC transporter permease [Bosea sp. (in: a-proteobacteria)]|mgnify:CR=1 FL=1|uniref:ABC transporter permease n=1 Tax=unclassified Bosea (in: a-proteobacteria) TaxID=2653178 RepID=UPI000962E076|nr:MULTISPECIES: ABC transporter permease [unclassified Bosea (in: a-proteobacteria)]MBN9442535.1 ABC transporter permease [Bosea sp. (in: a-proteobacteria)]MBN9459078.1 ABC transporter permease [Bosea sp. (in: a-proteobacteria)]OJV06563.1 MAG: glutathione ABC transporter permease GsiD [Bosea sp. 67-29]